MFGSRRKRTDGTTLRVAVTDFVNTFKDDLTSNGVELTMIGMYMFSNLVNNTHTSTKVAIGKVPDSHWYSPKKIDYSTYQ